MKKLNLKKIENMIGGKLNDMQEEKNYLHYSFSFRDEVGSSVSVLKCGQENEIKSYGFDDDLFEIGLEWWTSDEYDENFFLEVFGWLSSRQVENILKAVDLYGCEYVNDNFEEFKNNNSIIYEV